SPFFRDKPGCTIRLNRGGAIMEVQAAGEIVHKVAEEEEVRRSRIGSVWGNFIFRRFMRALLTIYLVTSFIFFLVRLLPGDPVQVYINRQMTQYGYSYDD